MVRLALCVGLDEVACRETLEEGSVETSSIVTDCMEESEVSSGIGESVLLTSRDEGCTKLGDDLDFGTTEEEAFCWVSLSLIPIDGRPDVSLSRSHSVGNFSGDLWWESSNTKSFSLLISMYPPAFVW